MSIKDIKPGPQNVPELNFQRQFSMTGIIWIFLRLFFIWKYKSRWTILQNTKIIEVNSILAQNLTTYAFLTLQSWDPTKERIVSVACYGIANFIASWLKSLPIIWNDSKWVYMCLINQLKSFEFILNQLEVFLKPWGNKINMQCSLSFFCRVYVY